MSGLIGVGDLAPDFELPDQHETPVRLSRLLAAGPVVLFFYPLAMSRGCTAESCHFRDLAAEFEATGATRVGISRDSVARQSQFDAEHDLGYRLLSDADGAVASEYGAQRNLPGLPPRRSTFVIGSDQRVRGVIRSELRMEAHADEALRLLAADGGPGPA
ncbi:peroxiredoxin [Knoellia aerolata]|uniref:thioredoxin-dependent peroxiredoxin n=1 Tax=Knoellia aerolata DSM 18566 TaxID=1385519 RepID=A0A0A0JYN7_9MICO|nr:peroxiredoxin [Knoellia aerolata]KGN41849.1 peroxiredoxin [Knoellia aerolata DSM 18566]